MPRQFRGILTALAASVAACLVTGAGVQGQQPAPATALRIVGTTPNGASAAPVTEAIVRFSEPMVAIGGAEVDRVGYVRVTPAVDVSFRWPDTNVLVITPRSGRFPYATSISIVIDAGATAVSGRRLGAPHTFTFSSAPPRLISARFRPRPAGAASTTARPILDLQFDQPVRTDDVLGHVALTLEPQADVVPVLSAEARERMARVDPDGLRQRDAWVRNIQAEVGVRRPIGLALAADARDGQIVALETVDGLPPGVQLTLVHSGVASPEGPLRHETPDRLSVTTAPRFTVSGPDCGGVCDPEAAFLQLSVAPSIDQLRRATTVTDITDASAERVLDPGPVHWEIGPFSRGMWPDANVFFPLRTLGYALEPHHRYAIRVDGSLTTPGQRLGAPWLAIADVGLRSSLVAVGSSGLAVWEASQGPRVPVLTRSLLDVRAGVIGIAPGELVSAMSAQRRPPIVSRQSIPVAGPPDGQVHEVLVDASPALGPGGMGLIQLDVGAGADAPGSGSRSNAITVVPGGYLTNSLIQVTNIGVTVRGSQHGLAVLATRLDTGDPVADADVTLVDTANVTRWRGRTAADGLATSTPSRAPTPTSSSMPRAVIVQKDGDIAFGLVDAYSWGAEDGGALVGVLFTDRGVYRPGESIHVKALMQLAAPRGLTALPARTALTLTLTRDGDAVQQFRATTGQTGGADWLVPIPAAASTDELYELTLRRGAPDASLDDYDDGDAELSCPIVIKAVRAAEFGVEVTASAASPSGAPAIDVHVAARDLTDVPLAQAPVGVLVKRIDASAPQLLNDDTDFTYGDGDDRLGDAGRLERRASGTLDAQGELGVRVALPAGLAGRGTFEVAVDVRDTSSQAQGARTVVTSFADVYLGLAADSDRPSGAAPTIRLVGRTPAGAFVAGLPVELRFRAGDEPADGGVVVSAVTSDGPVGVDVPAAYREGTVLVQARSPDGGRVVAPVDWYVALGTARPSPLPEPEPLVTLTLDRERYQPNDRARLHVASPWPRGTALVTLERGAVLESHVLRLSDGAADLDFAVGATALEGLVVAATVVRGRTEPCCARGLDDPGRPRATTASIPVVIDRAATKLAVSIDAPAGARPAARPTIRVRVRDDAGRPVRGDVTLWAVDEGVLKLTAYRIADPLAATYERGWPTLGTTDTRDQILLRRLPPRRWDQIAVSARTASMTEYATVSSPPDVGDDAVVRRDLRPLAFWSAAVATNADGVAEIRARLPDTLTTYRVMAIAADATARYGTTSATLVVSQPVMARPALPRFLTRRDTADLRTTVAAVGVSGAGTVVVESLTPGLLRADPAPRPITVGDLARAVATTRLEALAAGVAKVRVTATLGAARDVIERDLPIVDGTMPETAAVTGEAAPEAVEMLRPPAGADPDAGGLDLEIASTRLVGLSAAGDYVTQYRYLCAEQVASRALVLVSASTLGRALPLSGGPATLEARRIEAQRALQALESYRCGDGHGVGYWAHDCRLQSPYLTAYVLFVLETAVRHGFTVSADFRSEMTASLERALASRPGMGGIVDDVAWRAFAVKVLVDAGRRPAAAIDTLAGDLDALPVFALAHLFDAVRTLDAADVRVAELRRRLQNAITVGVTAHVEERTPSRYAWCWPSSTKSTAIVLDALARAGSLDAEQARAMTAWLLGARKRATWAGTQENVWALIALGSYQRAFEPGAGRASGRVTLDGTLLLQHALDPRRPAATRLVPMTEITRALAGTGAGRLTVAADGGPVFYTARLGYRVPAASAAALDHGIALSRRYLPVRQGDDGAAATTFAAGDLVRVVVSVRLSESRTFVAVTDALPAGFEVVDTSLATTATGGAEDEAPGGYAWWRSGFDRIERYDQRVDLFATSLLAGEHTVSYLARATTPGMFFAAPTQAEAMYEPEVAGRGTGTTIVITPAQ